MDQHGSSDRGLRGPRRSPARGLLVSLLGALGLAYAGYAAVAWATQRELLYPGRRFAPPADAGEGLAGLERWWLPTSVGQVEAWFLPAGPGAPSPGPAVIFAHGNGEHIDDWPAHLAPYQWLGLHVLLVEYPGYGRSQGSPSEASIVETFERAYDRLVERPGVDPARIVLHGRSLGGGAVAALCERRAARALVLQSCFTSVRAFAAGMLLPELLVRDPFDVEGPVARFGGKVLVLHAEQDAIVPPAHSRALLAAARDGRAFSWPGGHNEPSPDLEAYWRAIEAFLVEAGVLPRG